MIARLRGHVAAIGEDSAVVDVGGVGYLVTCAASTLQRLPGQGESVELHTELALREDGMTLYGFLDPADRVWFRLLQTVQGVGARVALALLGVLRPGELASAIAIGDKAALTRASGVGSRLAARIVAELKDRVATLPTGPAATAVLPAAPALGGPTEDALSVLVNLGYGRSEAYAAIARVQAQEGEVDVDRLIRESLQALTR